MSVDNQSVTEEAKAALVTWKHVFQLGMAVSKFPLRKSYDLMSREDVWDFATRNNDEVEMVKHAQAVYWSYNLTTEIDLATLKEIDGKQFGGYHLTNSGK